VESVDASLINYLLADGRVPVVAPLGCECADGRPTGGLLNINADTAAGHLAAELGAERLVFMTDVPGIFDAEQHVRERMTGEEAVQMIAEGVIAGGMIPKVQAGITATRAGTATRIVDGREPHALLEALTQAPRGTVIG
jgi:acetylglutamate kinase